MPDDNVPAHGWSPDTRSDSLTRLRMHTVALGRILAHTAEAVSVLPAPDRQQLTPIVAGLRELTAMLDTETQHLAARR